MSDQTTDRTHHRGLLGVMYMLHEMTGRFRPGTLHARVETDLDRIRRMGFNTVYLFDISRDPQLGATYSQFWYPEDAPDSMEPLSFAPELGREIEGAFGRVFRLANEMGLKVIPAICYNIPLQWLWSNQDAVKRRADGSPHYTVYYHECFRSEKVREYTKGRLKQLLERYAQDPDFGKTLARFRIEGRNAVLDEDGRPLLVIHNDTVDRGFCYCEGCRSAWADEFLPRIYGDIGTFNAAHGTTHGSFSDVPLPADKADERLWYELSMFFTEGLMGWMAEIRSAIRQYLPEALLSIVMKYPRSGWAAQYPDWVRVSELCDVLFMDAYPMESGEKWNMQGYAFDFETYRSISLITGKPILSQYQMSYSYTDFDMKVGRAPTVKEILQQFYIAIGRGTRGFVCWGLPPGIADDTDPASPLGEEEAVRAAARINEEAERLFEASEGTEEVLGSVMLPYSYPTVIRREGLKEPFRIYSFLSKLGIPSNPAYTDLISKKPDILREYRAILGFASLRNVRKEDAEGLAYWIGRDGGALLCGAEAMTRDQNGNAAPLEFFSDTVLGSHAIDAEAEGDLEVSQDHPYLPRPGTYARPDSQCAIASGAVEAAAVWSQSRSIAVTAREVGNGLAMRAGLRGDIMPEDGATSALIQALIKYLPDPPIRIRTQDVEEASFCLRKGGDVIAYLVSNEPHPSHMNLIVHLDRLMRRGEFMVTNAMTGEAISGARVDGDRHEVSVSIELPPLASVAIRIHPEA